MAAASTCSPLRGSSRRPRKEIVGAWGLPAKRGSLLAAVKGATYTPLGITTASPPWYWMRVRRASSDTAMRAVILSMSGTAAGESSLRARDRGMAAWKVPTTGQEAAWRAIVPTLGMLGSWMWSRSKS